MPRSPKNTLHAQKIVGIKKICWVSWDRLTLPQSAGGLGFREIQEFNESLLAKISWKILNEPNSLLARTYKGKYFPSSTFMEVEKAKAISHGWAGVLKGRDVLYHGLGWLVENGRNISMWNDGWLSTSQPCRPMGPPPFNSINMKVSELIHQATNTWNIFEDTITSIVLSSCLMGDVRVWLPVKSGMYTTKSGYALSKLNVEPVQGEVFNWKACIWKVDTAPKQKMFLWKLKSKALAVGRNLMTRGITNAIHCFHCGAIENEIHVIWDCPFARKAWELAPILFMADPSIPLTVNQFLEGAKKHINLPPSGLAECPLYPWIVWNLWKARNQLIFENRVVAGKEVLIRAIKEARSWLEAKQMVVKPKPQRTRRNTQSLNQQYTHCFVDASWIESSRNCGLGWCFKDKNMITITTQSESITKVSSALLGEALAMKAALTAAKNIGIQELNCFSDSLSLITLINTNEVTNELRSVFFDIHCLKKEFTSIFFAFIPRSDNVLADSLAKFGIVTLNSFS